MRKKLDLIKQNEDSNLLGENMEQIKKPKKVAMKIAAVYGTVSMLWIIFSDKILYMLISDISQYKNVQSYKGIVFVTITTFLIYSLVYVQLNLLKKANLSIEKSYINLIETYGELAITEEELKAQLDESRATNERYQLLMEGSKDGIWEWDLEKNEFYFSLLTKGPFGFSQSEIGNSYEQWNSLIHPEDKKEVMAKFNDYLTKASGTYKNTYRLRCKDGSYRWVLTRGKAVWDSSGKPMRVAGSHTDLTEQLKLQEKLEKEKTFSQNIMDNTSVIMAIWDHNGKVIKINSFAEELLEYRNDEVVGKNWVDIIIPKEERERVIDTFPQIKNPKNASNYEKKVVTKSGELYDILWKNSLLFGEGKDAIFLAVGVNITETKRLEQQMHNLYYFDNITNLPNRQMIKEETEEIISKSPISKFAMIYLDIDNFKNVNDTLGHSAGDHLLRHVADVLISQVGPNNKVARLGGDEFLLIVQFKDIDKVLGVIEKVMKNLRNPWISDQKEFYISTSAGIAVYPDHGKNFETLLKNADSAMYAVKENGKDNFGLYTDETQQKRAEYMEIANDLYHAIYRDEFKLYYQPIIDLKSKKIIAVEALLRWFHPEKGIIPPDKFIPIAEDTGQIHNINSWVLNAACEQKKIWEEKGFVPIIMSVNFSCRCFNELSLVQEVQNIIAPLGIKYSEIQLEITETALIQNIEGAMDIIKGVKELGIKVALDDFGSGYSSLTYLKKLPIDTLKMDREFLRAIDDAGENEIIVKKVIELAHALGMEVVGEGIETKEQLEFLINHGCDEGQGYLFSRPAPPSEIENILAKR